MTIRYSLLLIDWGASVVIISRVTDQDILVTLRRGLVKFAPDALNLASIVVRGSLDGRTA